MPHKVYGAILGFVVGDALGVPVEFNSRESLRKNPVIDMREFGTYNQPKGTWSDDTSMTLCTMESFLVGVDYDDMMFKFSNWLTDGYRSAHGEAFDVGIGTRNALYNFAADVPAVNSGGGDEFDNGNGSLMRMLPLVFYTMGMPLKKKFEIVENISALTHAHVRSKIACAVYVQFASELLKGYKKEKALRQTMIHINDFYGKEKELINFKRIQSEDIHTLKEDEIKSSGYVVHTLEAVLWSFFTTNTYKECVLKAVNLGEDTDTTAAIAGGLAGIYYGSQGIPQNWINSVVKLDDIQKLCAKFALVYKPFDGYYRCAQHEINESEYRHISYDNGYMDYNYFETLHYYSVKENADVMSGAISHANMELLLAINTYYLRKDRFCERTISECIQDGTFSKVIDRMRELEVV